MKRIVLILCILLSACTSTTSYVEELYKAKVQYVGDTSKVSLLLTKIGLLDEYGTSTLVLETSSEPYEIKIILEEEISHKEIKAFERASMIQHYIVLSLVENVDLVSIEYEYEDDKGSIHKQIDSLNSNEATLFLGSDIKEFGVSKDAIQGLLDVLEVKIP